MWLKSQKEELQSLSINFQRVDCGPLVWFWKNFKVNPNEPFHMQHYGIWKIMRIFTKKSFQYQTTEFSYLDKFWVEPLAREKSGSNKLTKMSFKLRFYYILVMKTFKRRSFCCEMLYLIKLYILVWANLVKILKLVFGN